MGDNKLQAGKFLTCKTVGFKTALYGLSAICKELAGDSLKSKKDQNSIFELTNQIILINTCLYYIDTK